MSKFFISGVNGYCRCPVNDDKTLFDVQAEFSVNAPSANFYQVGKKKEKVGRAKNMILIKKDVLISDDPRECREILGLKPGADAEFSSGIGGSFDIFVESTSSNRGVKEGSFALFRISKEDAEKGAKAAGSSTTEAKAPSSPAKSPAKRKADALPEVEAKKAAKTEVKLAAPISDTKKASTTEVKTSAPSKAGSRTSGSPLTSNFDPNNLKWSKVGSVMVLDCVGLPGSSKIIGFDMDSTLVVPKSGKKFANGADDWLWWNPKVVPTLQEYSKNGYKIVIFTNQAGIEKKKVNPKDIETKIIALSKAANVPFQAFASAATDHCRKPHTFMWDLLIDKYNAGVKPNMADCRYVGDAAGRPKDWKGKVAKDFSCGDRKFGWNCGLAFQTPEEFFLGEAPVAFTWQSLDPAAYLKSLGPNPTGFTGSSITKSSQEMVMFVGMPASGKSTFAEKHFIPAGYEWINKDTHKTKCAKMAAEAVAKGKRVVVDNTSPTLDARSEFIQIAKHAGVAVRCFVFDNPREVNDHLNFFREALTKGDRRRVPDVAYNIYKSKFVMPSTAEGFSEICTVKFAPDFKTPEEKKLFLEWTE